MAISNLVWGIFALQLRLSLPFLAQYALKQPFFSLTAFLTLCALSFSVLHFFFSLFLLSLPIIHLLCLFLFFSLLQEYNMGGLLLDTPPAVSLIPIVHSKSLPPLYLTSA